jgi:hypothetical protein
MKKAKSELVMLYDYFKDADNKKQLHIRIVRNKNLDVSGYKFVKMRGDMEEWHQIGVAK